MFTIASLIVAAPYTLVVGGDLMFNGIRPGTGPLTGVAETLREADFAFANLEVPLTNSKTVTQRKSAVELKARSQFVLKADPKHIASLVNAGIDAVSLANNHAMDYGASGNAEMRRLLAGSQIRFAGAGPDGDSASALTVVTGRDGFRVGLLSALAFAGRGALRKCSPAGLGAPGVNVLAFDGRIDDNARAKLASWVGSAKSRCDYLVVALHWGIERQPKPNGYQKALGHAVIDAGADLVWGHHPHVLEPAETYKGAAILYSTGNLVSALPARTALYRLEIDRHATTSVTEIPVTISGGKTRLVALKARSMVPKRILRTTRRFGRSTDHA